MCFLPLAISAVESGRTSTHSVDITGSNLFVDAGSGKKTDYIAPDKTYSYVLVVSNDATFEDNFTLKITSVPTGWSVTFDGVNTVVDTGTVGSGSDRNQDVIVRTNSADTDEIIFEATSYKSGVTEHVSLILVSGKDPIELVPDEYNKQVSPNSEVVYDLSITNNLNRTITLDLSFGSTLKYSTIATEDDWTGYLSKTSINLSFEETVVLDMYIRAPINGTPGLSKIIQIEARIQNELKTYYSNEITTVIKEEYDLVVSTPTTITAAPLEWANFTVSIKNNALISDTLSLQIVGGDAWAIEMSGLFTFMNEQKTVNAGSTSYIYMNIPVPLNAQAGLHYLKTNLTSKGGTYTLDFPVMVTSVYGFNMDSMEDSDECQGGCYKVTKAGTDVEVKLINTGNFKDTVELELISLPSQWTVKISYFKGSAGATTEETATSPTIDMSTNGNKKMVLTAGVSSATVTVGYMQTVYVGLHVTVTDSATVGTNSFDVLYRYGPPASRTTTKYTVQTNLLFSDLEFTPVLDDGLTYISQDKDNITAGEKVKFTVEVQNNYPLDASDVTVIMRVDGETKEEQTVSVPSGGSTEVEFTWKAEEGNHAIEFLIVGEGATTDTAPRKTTNVGVEASDETSNLPLIIALIVIVILIVVVVAGFIGYTMYQKTQVEDVKAKEYDLLYGDEGEYDERVKQEIGGDDESDEFLHGAKTKSRKSKEDLDEEAKDLYGGKKRGRKGRKGKRAEPEEEEEEKPKRGKKGRKKEEPEDEEEEKPKRGKKGRKKEEPEDDEPKKKKGSKKGTKGRRAKKDF